MKRWLPALLALAAAIPLAWLFSRAFPPHPAAGAPAANGRKILYYQSAMHPWIKSDKPGRCTICGMELTPIYEGDAGFGASGDIVPLAQSSIRAANVQSVEIAKRPLGRSLQVAGTIDDSESRRRALSAYIPGRITKLYVNYAGAEVKEGEPLADFYSPVLLQAEREYRSLSGELKAATALRLLQMGLTKPQIDALPKKPADSLASQIVAPIGGTVVSKNVYEGQYVQEGETLFEIADLSTMWFQFEAYEQDLPWLEPGLRVDVTTPSLPGRIFSGEIAFIDPNFDGTTRSTKVRVELDNPLVDGRRLLMNKLYAEGSVHLPEPEVLAAPKTAVLQTGREAVAYIDLGEGAYRRTPLQLGRRGDAFIEVLSGLEAGQKVVVNGNLLIDGQAEINRSYAAPAPAPSPSKYPPADDRQKRALDTYFTLASKLSDALAADDLPAFNRATAGAENITGEVVAAFPPESPWRELVRPLESLRLREAASFPEARRSFLGASNPAAQLALALGEQTAIPVRVFRCPMTKMAFDGAPDHAEWVQSGGAARNPYFGSAMPDCGEEILPGK